ncbi:methyltransferase domain-containing protein [Micromonospora sp. WMMD1102]|uniref:THUMP-like domain-containing protein n=1 Tax=Micromonospora sp. WMMD1102 TaxID=3016105 RepID=UPI00241575DA|nr:methyltransferase domain-containing protein [Micromonospora sp. WMMD1102]MDG4789872.1 methyltransferase domain-containing protein [Micromonospora sp. WMMD1102]
MDLEQFAALRTPEGGTALAAAAELAGGDPLAAAAALRAAGVPAGLAAAALTQAGLRRRAAVKFGPEAAGMFFTRAGLEQATRAAVAARRAARLRAAGVGTLVDLGCGLGADAIAAARAGIRVYGVEADPLTAAMAAANAGAAGVAETFTVTLGDATRFDLTAVQGRPVDAVFCDPARRRAGTGRRIFDPAAYSPPWDFLLDLVDRVPRTVFKVAPGIEHRLLPAGAEGEWVSVDGDLVEATVWSGPTDSGPHGASPTNSGPTDSGPLGTVPRRATLLVGSAVHELTGDGTRQAPVGPLRRYLYDPDPAVVRSHLVAEFAGTVDGTLADPEIAYVYADTAHPTPYARCLEVVEALPFSLKRLRARLRELGVGRAEILKRGSALEPERLRRDLRLAGDAATSLVLTRVAGAPTVLLCRPLPAPDLATSSG